MPKRSGLDSHFMGAAIPRHAGGDLARRQARARLRRTAKRRHRMSASLRDHARRIGEPAVAAARPEPLVRRAWAALAEPLRSAARILVLGGGKAGAAMAEAVEHVLADRLEGVVNVPAD